MNEGQRRCKSDDVPDEEGGEGMSLSYEQCLLEWLQHHLLEQDPHIGEGGRHIRVEEVHLESGQEEDMVVILFREDRRPSCLFGFRMPVYEDISKRGQLDDPSDVASLWGEMIVGGYLTEQIVAGGMGLPKDCSPDSITWIN